MRKKALSVWLASLLVATIFTVIFAGSVSAVNNDHNLSGIVYESDFSNPIVATNFCIWVERIPLSGNWNRFPATGWIQTQQGVDLTWWYSFVLPNEEKGTTWETNDFYMVQVDGTPWSEANANTTSHGTGSEPDDPVPPYNPSSPASGVNSINYFAGMGGFGNEQQWDVMTVAPIDLVLTNVTADGKRPAQNPNGFTANPNQNVGIFFNVTNLGTVPSGPFNATLYNMTSSGVNLGLIVKISIPSIPAGGDSGMLNAIWYSPLAPGKYYVNLTIDNDDDVPEFDEGNNQIILNFTVGPDLILKDVLVEFSAPPDPTMVAPNQTVRIDVTIENIGVSSTVVPVSVGMYNISGPNGIQIDPEQQIDVGVLDAGDIVYLTFYWPAPATLGDRYINLTADYNDDCWEAIEDNNDLSIHFNITQVPVTYIYSTIPIHVSSPPFAVWYINSFTELYFDVPSDYFPPYYTHYRILWVDNGTEAKTWTNYTDEGSPYFNMEKGEGSFEIQFYSTDSVGAVETTKRRSIIVDDTEPTSIISISIPRFRQTLSDNWNITSTTPIRLIVTDNPLGYSSIGVLNASGVSEISYRIIRVSDSFVMQDWGPATVDTVVDGMVTSEPFILDPLFDDDWYTIEYYSKDNLGHTEGTKSETIYLDNTHPTKVLNYGLPYYREDAATDDWNITSASEISITSDDGFGSGVNNTQYRVWGPGFDTGWVTYSAAFTISSSWIDTVYTLEYNSTDNLGNENTRISEFYLDNTGPDTTIVGDHSSIYSTSPLRYEITLLTIFNISAVDAGSGVQYTEYMLESEGIWRTYTTGLSYDDIFADAPHDQRTGEQTIVARSVDNLGTMGPDEEFNVYIEEDVSPPDPPVLEIEKDGNDLRLDWHYLSDMPEDVAYYRIYSGSFIDDSIFKNLVKDTSGDADPLRTSWPDGGAAADDDNHYYVITAVDTKDNEGYTSNIVGKVTLTFKEGYNSFALPLRPFDNPTASDMIEDPKFTDDRDTIYQYDTEYKQWMGHPKDLPSSMDNFELEFGKGYMIYIVEEDIKFSFTGSSASAIRYMKGVIGSEVDDKEFRDSLEITYNNGNLELSWIPLTDASGYNIYKGMTRFGEDSLNDFTIDMANENGAVTGLTFEYIMGVDETELYFLVVPLDANGMEGASTYAVGVKKVAFSEGYSVISMELQPKPQQGVGFLANDMFDENSGTLFYYDKENSEWRGHPRDLPENINNVVVNTGSAYIVYVDAGDVSYVFTGV